jgi:hypothetical protein
VSVHERGSNRKHEVSGNLGIPDQRVRIFVSSTIQELAAERIAARDAIQHLRLTPSCSRWAHVRTRRAICIARTSPRATLLRDGSSLCAEVCERPARLAKVFERVS